MINLRTKVSLGKHSGPLISTYQSIILAQQPNTHAVANMADHDIPCSKHSGPLISTYQSIILAQQPNTHAVANMADLDITCRSRSSRSHQAQRARKRNALCCLPAKGDYYGQLMIKVLRWKHHLAEIFHSVQGDCLPSFPIWVLGW
jgi:hypothetical protein